MTKRNSAFSIAPALIIVWLSRVLTFLAFPHGTRFPDSAGYTLEESTFNPGWLLGDLQRPWPTPILYTLMPSDPLRVLGQLTLSGAAWTLLIIAAAGILKGPISRLGVGLGLALLASTPFVLQWDSSLLAPSLIQTALVALLSSTIWLLQEVTWPRIFLTLAASAVLGAAKGPHLVIIGVLLATIAVALRSRMTRQQLVAFSLSTILIAGWSFVVSYNVDRSWPHSYSGQTALWLLGGQSRIAEPLSSWLQASGAPSCVTADAPYAELSESISAVVQECPEASAYLRESMQSDVISFLASNPGAASRLVADGLGASIITNGTQYGSVYTVVPQSVASIFFGSITPDPRDLGASDQVGAVDALRGGKPFTVFAPQVLWLIASLVVLAIIITRDRTSHRMMAVMLLAFSLALIVASMVTIVAAPTEWARQLGPYWTSLIAIALMAVGLAICSAPRSRGTSGNLRESNA